MKNKFNEEKNEKVWHCMSGLTFDVAKSYTELLIVPISSLNDNILIYLCRKYTRKIDDSIHPTNNALILLGLNNREHLFHTNYESSRSSVVYLACNPILKPQGNRRALNDILYLG